MYKGGEKVTDCCMNQEMKFFPKGPVPLSTLQRMDKLAVKIVDSTFFFLPFILPNELLVCKDTLTTTLENTKCFSAIKSAIRVGLQAQKSSGKDPEILVT